MSTDKQIVANRANAQQSTGPSTAAGKAKVASNGLTHGLNATPETLFAANPEDPKSFSQLERTLKMAAALERRADKAMRELRNLQRDRVAALNIQELLRIAEQTGLSK